MNEAIKGQPIKEVPFETKKGKSKTGSSSANGTISSTT